MNEIKGVFPVIATPFKDDGSIDETGFRNILRYVLNAGAHGVVYPAVASEFYALSQQERMYLSECLMEEVKQNVPVIICTTGASRAIAEELTRHARDIGADAVMVMAPYVVKDNQTGITRHFEEITRTADIPVVLQNAPPPLGSAQSVEAILNILRTIPAIQYVKEENLPCGQRISGIRSEAPDTLKGVFGGAGGRYIIDELKRGVIGAMPACELTEIHVNIYNCFRDGKHSEARRLYYRSLPLLNFQAVFRMNMTKEVLKKRGIIENTFVRVGGTPLDDADSEELHLMLDEVKELLIH